LVAVAVELVLLLLVLEERGERRLLLVDLVVAAEFAFDPVVDADFDVELDGDEGVDDFC
jgi:hypothetical protein